VADCPCNTYEIMENPTQFDLNEAIQNWRRNMAASPAFQPDDLDELEFHLHDSIRSLRSKGLSDYEAFWLAKNRLGPGDLLDCEFGKVNAERVWLNRALWMVIGSLAIGALSSLASIIVALATIGVHELRMQERLLGPFSMIAYVFTLVGLFLLVWRSGQQSNGLIWRIDGWMRTHRIAAAVSVFLLLALGYASSLAGNVIVAKTVPRSIFGVLMVWRSLAALTPILFWPFVLAWLLRRITRKTIPTK
jgi:hypothetical protein